MTSFLDRLRTATADRHRALDAAVTVASPGAPPPAWHRYLVASWGWAVAVERTLAAAAGDRLPAAGARLQKEAWLRHDLAVLGLAAAEIDALPLAAVPAAGRLAAGGRWWGYAYVAEGATLGGQVLARQAEEALGWRPRFLAGYGADTARRWHQFRAALERQAAERPQESTAVVAAARHAFATVHAWLVPRPGGETAAERRSPTVAGGGVR